MLAVAGSERADEADDENAAAQADDALRGQVTLWVMTSSGSERCELAKDQALSTASTESAAAQGIGGTLTVSGSCAGQTLQAGDRIVAELGSACTAETVPPVAASLYRGGAGTALSDVDLGGRSSECSELSKTALYLGDGSRRGGTRLGAVKESGAETYIASEDGLAIYVFDTDTGLLKRTLHGLSKAVVYAFDYGPSGVTVTDGDGNVTTIGAAGITGPFGEQTGVAVGTDDYWATIGQGVGAMELTYAARSADFAETSASAPFAAGLMQTLKDPRGNTWGYTFNAYGELQTDDDPSTGHITATRQGLAPAAGESADLFEDIYKLTLSTAGGKDFGHEVKNYVDGTRKRTISTPDGDTDITIRRDLSATATYPGGSASSAYTPGQLAT